VTAHSLPCVHAVGPWRNLKLARLREEPDVYFEDIDAAVLFVRGVPRDLLAKLKAAALQQKTLGEYIQEMCVDHVQELERKGVLPKSK
jgi:hypothetical protein